MRMNQQKPKRMTATASTGGGRKSQAGAGRGRPMSAGPKMVNQRSGRPAPRPAAPKTGGVMPRGKMGGISKSAVMPGSKPISRTGGARPSRPAPRPAGRPSRPQGRPAGRPSRGGMLGAVMERSETPRRPSGRPGGRPTRPAPRPMGSSVGRGRRGRVGRAEGGLAGAMSKAKPC